MTHCRQLRLAPLVLIVIGVACAKSAPRIHHYVLRAQAPSHALASGGSSNAPHIGINAFRVDPPYDGDRIVYRVGEQSPEIGLYAYHRWAAPLARMLPSITADTLNGTTGLEAMNPTAPGRRYDATLHGHLLVLEEIDVADGQIVRLRLELTLQSTDGTVLWATRLHEDGRANTDGVADIVDAMEAAIGRALARAGDGLGEAARAIAVEIDRTDP